MVFFIISLIFGVVLFLGIDSGVWPYVIAAILAVYDVLVRLIPTIKNVSIIHSIIEFLLWISNKLNVQKK
jgi:hypothetical protein